MTDRDPGKQVVAEILPPARVARPMPEPVAPPGIPLLVQARYGAVRRKLEAYIETLDTQRRAYGSLEALVTAKERFERAVVRMENLDDIRLIESLKITKELSAITEELGTIQDNAKLRQLSTRARLARAEAEAVQAERDLAIAKGELRSPKTGPARWNRLALTLSNCARTARP